MLVKMPITRVMSVLGPVIVQMTRVAVALGRERDRRRVLRLEGLLEAQVDVDLRRRRGARDLHAPPAGLAVAGPRVDGALARVGPGVLPPELGIEVLPRRPRPPAMEVDDLRVDPLGERTDGRRSLDGVRVARHAREPIPRHRPERRSAPADGPGRSERTAAGQAPTASTTPGGPVRHAIGGWPGLDSAKRLQPSDLAAGHLQGPVKHVTTDTDHLLSLVEKR